MIGLCSRWQDFQRTDEVTLFIAAVQVSDEKVEPVPVSIPDILP